MPSDITLLPSIGQPDITLSPEYTQDMVLKLLDLCPDDASDELAPIELLGQGTHGQQESRILS